MGRRRSCALALEAVLLGAGFSRIVPELFDPATRACLAAASPQPEGDRQVLFCAPYAFYFGRAEGGEWRLLEFGADGEDAP